MTIHWADLAFTLAIVAAGCGAGYVLLLRKMRQAVEESHRELARRLTALIEAIPAHEAGGAVSSTDALTAQEIEEDAPPVELRTTPAERVEIEKTAAEDMEEVSPEIQVAIAAAAIALLGNNARVRAARRIPSRDVISPWTQQGRVIVQSSHNLRTRR